MTAPDTSPKYVLDFPDSLPVSGKRQEIMEALVRFFCERFYSTIAKQVYEASTEIGHGQYLYL